jgi:hypothetical protein
MRGDAREFLALSYPFEDGFGFSFRLDQNVSAVNLIRHG